MEQNQQLIDWLGSASEAVQQQAAGMLADLQAQGATPQLVYDTMTGFMQAQQAQQQAGPFAGLLEGVTLPPDLLALNAPDAGISNHLTTPAQENDRGASFER